MKKSVYQLFALTMGCLSFLLFSCSSPTAKSSVDATAKGENKTQKENKTVYPIDLLPVLKDYKILLGNGTSANDLTDFEHKEYFYTVNDGTDWVVYKTPNSGTTSPNSSNTRSELGQIKEWLPKTGGRMTGGLKVMHVSTSGDARVAASYSVVIGQIHSNEGHKNEPLKIFYKKFPGHTKGSVYWNYEINTKGDNSKRWDYSTAVWGHDMSVIGSAPDVYPEEPKDGIKLGEEFSYEVNVHNGIMYLTFKSKGHPAKKFTKSLVSSEYVKDADIPKQIRELYAVIDRDGTEKANAYEGELQFFKQGAYNQTNGKAPETNMVWSSGSNTFDGDLAKQYSNGSYTEVWFKESSLGPGIPPR